MSVLMPSIRARIGDFGLGAASLGNLYRPVTDDDARAVVATAWAEGVRYFDTAPHYGLGLSERRLGGLLSEHPRDDYLISTKVGRLLDLNPGGHSEQDSEGFAVPAAWTRRWDFSAAGVRRSLAESLERLGLDRVDILYLHDPENHLDEVLADGLPALVELRESGVVGAIGVGSKSTDVMTRLVATGDLDLAMVAGRYTLLEQPALTELLPAAEQAGTAVIAVGVFNSGLLSSPTPSASSTYEYGAVPPAMLERATRLAEVCGNHGVELPHAAVQFVLAHPLVVNATLGVGRPRHVAPNAHWVRTPVPADLWRELEADGLIPVGVTGG